MKKMEVKMFFVLSAFAFASFFASAEKITSSADWPRHRGDASLRGNSSQKIGAKLKLDWVFDTGDFLKSSVVVSGGLAYVGADTGILHALDVLSGKEKWKFNNIYNIPLPAGTNSEEYLNAFEFALKKLKEFKPEFVLISAGFDAHTLDPLAQFKLQTEDYYIITKRILEITKKFCSGKVVSILEGGYDLDALRDSTKRHVDALIEFR